MNDALADPSGASDVLHGEIVIAVFCNAFDGSPYNLLFSLGCHIVLGHI
jgi:hypothetical protein